MPLSQIQTSDIEQQSPGARLGANPSPTPMAVACKFTKAGNATPGHVIYFRSDGGIGGPGFGGDIPELLGALAGVQQALSDGSQGDGFFISMIPSSFLRFDPPKGPTVPEFAAVPNFHAFFDPICRVLQDKVGVPCDISIEVKMEDRWSYCDAPRLALQIYKRACRDWVSPEDLGIELDVNSQACQELLSWYSGCAHGLVTWKPKKRRGAQLLKP
ncbi:hypothetical protein ACYSUW_14190 [Pseudomonas frederiksbergensis]